jgi:hypothetical protein
MRMRPSASASGVDPCCTCCCCLSVLGVRERRQDICGYVYAPRSRSLLRLHQDAWRFFFSLSLHLIIRSRSPLCRNRNRGSRGPTPISTLLFPMNSKQERGHKWGGGDRIHHRQLSDASSARSVACPWYACFCGLSDGRVLRLSFTSRVRVAFFSLSSGVLGVSVTVHDVELDKSER